jgi:hypothetical protein
LFIGPDVNHNENNNKAIVTVKKTKGLIKLVIDLNGVSRCFNNEFFIKFKIAEVEIRINAVHPIGINKLKILAIK